MSVDYAGLGLRCGLELHQQLDTTKLFCACPSRLRDEEPDIKVVRRLRAVAGELGELDIAAMHEILKDRYFVYEGYRDSTCAVEFDEEPPRSLNPDALGIALQLTAMLRARPVDEVQVMRKIVIDGSNTSGFQRTALVGRDGTLEIDGAVIKITTICLEEESARPTARDPRSVTYRLDRQGIPLIEIATGPDITSPEQARAVAERLGMILRSTGRVRRGIGTIRQDINVSISGGARVEIKGCQELGLLPRLIDYEIARQLGLIELSRELSRRRVSWKPARERDVSAAFEGTKIRQLRAAAELGWRIFGLRLAGFAGLLGRELQPGKSLADELAKRAEILAGITTVLNSDELTALSETELAGLRKALGLAKEDAFVLLAGQPERIRRAAAAISERARQCLVGVPEEVRGADPEGTTHYLRPMPGAARMYPETDVPPVRPDLAGIKIPELLSDIAARLRRDYGLSKDLAELLANSGKAARFESFVAAFPRLKPAFIAESYLSAAKVLRRQHGIELELGDELFGTLFSALNAGKIAKESLPEILLDYARTGKLELERFRTLSEAELEKRVRALVRAHPKLELGLLMARAMSELRGRASADRVIALIKRYKGR